MPASYEADELEGNAMVAEHADRSAEEIMTVFGREPATIALHSLLASAQVGQAALAALLGGGGLRIIKVNGRDLTVPACLRLLSRLCAQAAEHEDRAFEAGESEAVLEAESPFMLAESPVPKFPEPQAMGQTFPGGQDAECGPDPKSERRAAVLMEESPFQFGAAEMEKAESFGEEAVSQSETRTAKDDETDTSEVQLEEGAGWVFQDGQRGVATGNRGSDWWGNQRSQ